MERVRRLQIFLLRQAGEGRGGGKCTGLMYGAEGG